MLSSHLLAAHSRHLPSSGCQFVAPFSQPPSSPWSLQQEPSISLHSLTHACWACASGFEVPYNLSGSYPKNPNSDLRMLYSVILKMLQGSPVFLPALSSYHYWFMSSAALCSGGLWERRSWQRLANTQVGARGLICCTGSQQGHNCDISLPPTSQVVCSLVFKIPNIAFWHPASFDLKDCWVTDCSLHLPKSPPSLSLSFLFATPSSSFSQFICIL